MSKNLINIVVFLAGLAVVGWIGAALILALDIGPGGLGALFLGRNRIVAAAGDDWRDQERRRERKRAGVEADHDISLSALSPLGDYSPAALMHQASSGSG